jgi:hypothetical protein
MTEGAPLNTDDNMLIEYSAPLNLHRDTRRENLEMLMEHASLPDGALGSNASQWRRLAQIYQQRRDAVRYRSAMNRAMELDAQASP